MTLSPKTKAELHSVTVTFITTFIAALAPALAIYLNSGNAINVAEVSAMLVPVLRIAVKAVYSQVIHDYNGNAS